MFEKGYKGNWFPVQFVVSDMKNTRPSTYLLESEEGAGIESCYYKKEKVKHAVVFLLEKVLYCKKMSYVMG